MSPGSEAGGSSENLHWRTLTGDFGPFTGTRYMVYHGVFSVAAAERRLRKAGDPVTGSRTCHNSVDAWGLPAGGFCSEKKRLWTSGARYIVFSQTEKVRELQDAGGTEGRVSVSRNQICGAGPVTPGSVMNDCAAASVRNKVNPQESGDINFLEELNRACDCHLVEMGNVQKKSGNGRERGRALGKMRASEAILGKSERPYGVQWHFQTQAAQIQKNLIWFLKFCAEKKRKGYRRNWYAKRLEGPKFALDRHVRSLPLLSLWLPAPKKLLNLTTGTTERRQMRLHALSEKWGPEALCRRRITPYDADLFQWKRTAPARISGAIGGEMRLELPWTGTGGLRVDKVTRI
ncbi:hypothetical protein C8R43DRAFT_948053 [Mycena crocata]|nr:hypothetical protein C8R43DRAFT_948053 [Mycena crocata]